MFLGLYMKKRTNKIMAVVTKHINNGPDDDEIKNGDDNNDDDEQLLAGPSRTQQYWLIFHIVHKGHDSLLWHGGRLILCRW